MSRILAYAVCGGFVLAATSLAAPTFAGLRGDKPAVSGMSATARPLANEKILLNGGGLTTGGVKLVFDKTSRSAAIVATSAVLGKPTKTGSYGDCGMGDLITYAKFRGDFELSFVKGRLSGWTENGEGLATDRGLRVNDTVATLKKLYPDVFLEKGNEDEGGVGPSFQREGGPNGWLGGLKGTSRIGGLFAGATCLPGI